MAEDKLNLDLNKYLDQLRSLDTKNIGGWPTWVYGFACVLIATLIIGVGAYYLIKPQREALATEKAQEQTLKNEFETKQKKVAALDAYKEQLATMQREFGDMLRQLPSKAEIANLLNDISQTRVASGLEEELFEPKPEVAKDFYAEVPNALNITGTYHEMAAFVSGVSSLPRIVTLHDIAIKPKDKAAAGATGKPGAQDLGEPELTMTLTAKTFRYLDPSEIEAASTPGQPGAVKPGAAPAKRS